MNIFFDFEVNATKEQKDEMFSGNSGIVLNEIKSFIQQRIKILEDEINNYEDAYICMITMEQRFRLLIRFLPKSLSDKIDNSFSIEDFDYLSLKISRRLSD